HEARHPVFHASHASRYNTLHFASQSRVPNGGFAPFGNPHKKRRYATPPRGAYRLFLLSSPPAVSVEQKSAWDWCGIFNYVKLRSPTCSRLGARRPASPPAPPERGPRAFCNRVSFQAISLSLPPGYCATSIAF